MQSTSRSLQFNWRNGIWYNKLIRVYLNTKEETSLTKTKDVSEGGHHRGWCNERKCQRALWGALPWTEQWPPKTHMLQQYSSVWLFLDLGLYGSKKEVIRMGSWSTRINVLVGKDTTGGRWNRSKRGSLSGAVRDLTLGGQYGWCVTALST